MQEEPKEPEPTVEDSEEAATEEGASVEEETPEAEPEPEVVAGEPQPEEPSEEPEAEAEEESERTPSEEPQEESAPVEALAEEPAPEDPPAEEESPLDFDREMEIARLTAEIERLRGSLVGAAEVIEEIEETPMPPVVLDNIVIPPHVVADFARMGRQLSRESLVKGTMGAISMLHPDEPGLMISTRHSAMLTRLDERGIVGGRLGGDPPRGAIAEWKVHEVLLASVAMVTGGPAACIHMQGPYTTAASSEKDLILVQPIDVLGKEHIGKVVIVDPDDDAQEEFLRQVAEALQQGGMRCVVVRGYGAYAVGANLDQAMANAAMLEHSMQILLLARQANLKI
jgi:ribulose-5-phosphate 4-epimerase/fuculose-1-phosphate aldolase